MKYRVQISSGAAREIRRLPRDAAGQVLDAISELADDPRPAGAKKLEGILDCYRIRKGIYRIVYTIEDDILNVGIVTVGHRNEVYKRLKGKTRRRTR